MGNRHQRRHPGKPQGASYADVLAHQRRLKEACQQAANDTMVQLKSDIHTQRAMWLMCVAMNDAFGIGPERFKQFASCLQKRSDWYEEMRDTVDEEYANENSVWPPSNAAARRSIIFTRRSSGPQKPGPERRDLYDHHQQGGY